jgi:hypothetical protein
VLLQGGEPGGEGGLSMSSEGELLEDAELHAQDILTRATPPETAGACTRSGPEASFVCEGSMYERPGSGL